MFGVSNSLPNAFDEVLSSVRQDIQAKLPEIQRLGAARGIGIFCDEIAICIVESLARALPNGSYQQRQAYLRSASEILVPDMLYPHEAEAVVTLAERRLRFLEPQPHVHQDQSQIRSTSAYGIFHGTDRSHGEPQQFYPMMDSTPVAYGMTEEDISRCDPSSWLSDPLAMDSIDEMHTDDHECTPTAVDEGPLWPANPFLIDSRDRIHTSTRNPDLVSVSPENSASGLAGLDDFDLDFSSVVSDTDFRDLDTEAFADPMEPEVLLNTEHMTRPGTSKPQSKSVPSFDDWLALANIDSDLTPEQDMLDRERTRLFHQACDFLDEKLRRYVVDRACGWHDDSQDAALLACARYDINTSTLKTVPGGKKDIKKYQCGGAINCNFCFQARQHNKKWFVVLDKQFSNAIHSLECQGLGGRSPDRSPDWTSSAHSTPLYPCS